MKRYVLLTVENVIYFQLVLKRLKRMLGKVSIVRNLISHKPITEINSCNNTSRDLLPGLLSVTMVKAKGHFCNFPYRFRRSTKVPTIDIVTGAIMLIIL